MPIWISIILYIVSNIPTIIKLIREIWDLIKGAPKDVQVQTKQDLYEALKECGYTRRNKEGQDREKLAERLQNIIERLKNRA